MEGSSPCRGGLIGDHEPADVLHDDEDMEVDTADQKSGGISGPQLHQRCTELFYPEYSSRSANEKTPVKTGVFF